jgi:uncharacterized membrane protein HdeD (DUF308 family)
MEINMKTYTDDGSYDVVESFTERWNKRVHKFRITGIIAGIVMAVLGIILCVFPKQSINVIEYIADFLIIAIGIYQLVDYFNMPVMFQSGAKMVDGILNILIGILLLASPEAVAVTTFVFLFGILLLIYGVDLLSFTGKLSYFGVSGHGWVTATGIISIITAILFLCMPFVSAMAINYIMAIYLIIDGIALIIEMCSMKDLKIKDE